jgi:hypothetical protein
MPKSRMLKRLDRFHRQLVCFFLGVRMYIAYGLPGSCYSYMSLISQDEIGGRRWILVQDSTGMSIDRRAIAICASLRAASLLIDSQSLIGFI